MERAFSRCADVAIRLGAVADRTLGRTLTTGNLLGGLAGCGDEQMRLLLMEMASVSTESAKKDRFNVAEDESTYRDVLERASFVAEHLNIPEISTACLLYAITCIECGGNNMLGSFSRRVRRELAQFKDVPELATV